MRRLLFSFIVLIFLSGCSSQQPNKLEDAFILSLKKNDFKILNDFLPDKKFYDAVSQKMPKRTEKEIEDFLMASHERIKQAWQNTFYTVAEKKIDLDKVVIKEVFYHDPFPDDETNEAMIVDYEYKGSTWDDIQFIVSRKTGKIILLEIPNPTRSFSMRDKELRATNEARTWIEMNKPEFKKSIEEVSNKLIAAVKTNNLDEFGKYLIYRGADGNRLWRSPVNMNDSMDRKMAAQFMERVTRNLQSCENYKTGNFVTNRESEGLWITWPLDCGDRIVSLHYLRVDGRLLLGDTDVEEKK